MVALLVMVGIVSPPTSAAEVVTLSTSEAAQVGVMHTLTLNQPAPPTPEGKMYLEVRVTNGPHHWYYFQLDDMRTSFQWKPQFSGETTVRVVTDRWVSEWLSFVVQAPEVPLPLPKLVYENGVLKLQHSLWIPYYIFWQVDQPWRQVTTYNRTQVKEYNPDFWLPCGFIAEAQLQTVGAYTFPEKYHLHVPCTTAVELDVELQPDKAQVSFTLDTGTEPLSGTLRMTVYEDGGGYQSKVLPVNGLISGTTVLTVPLDLSKDAEVVAHLRTTDVSGQFLWFNGYQRLRWVVATGELKVYIPRIHR